MSLHHATLTHARIRMRLLHAAAVFALAAAALSAPAMPDPGLLYGQTREEFAARRAAVRQAMGDAILLIRGERGAGDVERQRFRTDNNIMYLTGVEAPDAVLALLPEGDPSGKREILFLPPQSALMRQWVDPVPGPGKETEESSGLQSAQSLSGMWAVLKPSLEKAKTLIVAGGRRGVDKYSPVQELVDQAKSANPAITVEPRATRLINALRWKKSPGEIANLRAAVNATVDAQRAAARTIRPGVTELAVEGAILEAYLRNGAERQGFPSIVGSGPYSIVLHHFAGPRKIEPNETVVVDIGAEVNYYSADVTRTFPSSGKFTPRQRQIYQLVLDTQAACEKFVVPGKTTMGELHRHAVEFMRKSPLRAKDDTGAERTMDAFFAHSLGHWLGMDVHDVSGGSSVFEPGTVFTIEPGIYIRSEGIGVRIEDDYLVTATGLDKLSKAAPSKVEEVEALMRTTRSARR